MQPKRIQRKRTKGYKMPPNTKSCTRPHKFGNRHKIGDLCGYGVAREEYGGKSLRQLLIDRHGEPVYHTVEETIMAFEEQIRTSSVFAKIIKRELTGYNLACFCPLDQPCHVDVLLEIANSPA